MEERIKMQIEVDTGEQSNVRLKLSVIKEKDRKDFIEAVEQHGKGTISADQLWNIRDKILAKALGINIEEVDNQPIEVINAAWSFILKRFNPSDGDAEVIKK